MRHSSIKRLNPTRPVFYTVLCIILLLIPMVASPLKPPIAYQRFIVNGTIERTGGGDLNNFTAMLLYKNDCEKPDEFEIIEDYFWTDKAHVDNRLDVTDSLGVFQLRVTMHKYIICVDSLVVGMGYYYYYPDKTVVIP